MAGLRQTARMQPSLTFKEIVVAHAFHSTLKTFKTAAGKTGQFYSLPALARQFPNIGRLPVSLRLVLESVDAALDLPLDAALAHEAVQFGVACGSDEKREGTTAFLEKRQPHFMDR